MLTNLFIDNYRSLVNFNFKPDALSLMVGDNGTGKSSVLDVIESLRDFIIDDVSVNVFDSSTLTRWQSVPQQTFGLELSIHGRTYKYELVVEHELQRSLRRVQRETLAMDGQPLYASYGNRAQLYRDDHSQGPEIPFDWSRSGIGFLPKGPDNTYLCAFREYIRHVVVVGLDPNPKIMSDVSDGACAKLERRGENFAAWYQFMMLEYPAAVSGMITELRELLPQFSALSLQESGDKRVMKVQFTPPQGVKKADYKSYGFKELSDGQRCLIILYALLYFAREKPSLLFFDEPDNYVALREIQSWIALLHELCVDEETGIQAIITSHSSEVINYIDSNCTHVLERPNGWATRLKPFEAVDGLTPAETLARGWE